MATITGTPGTQINAVATVGDTGTLADEGDQATTAQSFANDLATIRSGSYTTTAARTVGSGGSDTFASGSTLTLQPGAIASMEGRTQFRTRFVLLTDAAATVDVTNDTYVLNPVPASQRLMTLSSTIGPPKLGERIRFVCAGIEVPGVSQPYQFIRSGGPTGLLAKIVASAVILYMPISVEFEYGPGLALRVTGTASGSGGAVKLTIAKPVGGGSLGNPTDSLATGDSVVVSAVGGTVEANGTWTITVNDGTHITLTSTTFVNAWTSGGVAQITPGVWRLGINSGCSYDGTATVGLLPDGGS